MAIFRLGTCNLCGKEEGNEDFTLTEVHYDNKPYWSLPAWPSKTRYHPSCLKKALEMDAGYSHEATDKAIEIVNTLETLERKKTGANEQRDKKRMEALEILESLEWEKGG